MVELIVYSLVAFAAGALTFLAPCTLPILAAYFAYSGTSERSKILLNTLFFGLGLAIVFTALGLTAGSLGSLVLSFKREITYVFGILVILFGLMSIFGKSFKLFDINIETKRNRTGSLVFGGVFALTWTGCVGPILGFMLVMAANTQTALSGGLMLFVYSLGLISPLLLLSLFLDKLPKESRFWKFLRGRMFEFNIGKKKFHVHSTSLVTGIIFILFGLALMFNLSYKFINIFPGITEWVFDIEDKVVALANIGG